MTWRARTNCVTHPDAIRANPAFRAFSERLMHGALSGPSRLVMIRSKAAGRAARDATELEERRVIPGAVTYHRATSVGQAVSLLAELGEDARPLAGGHSLIPMMKLRMAAPSHLVDLRGLPS